MPSADIAIPTEGQLLGMLPRTPETWPLKKAEPAVKFLNRSMRQTRPPSMADATRAATVKAGGKVNIHRRPTAHMEEEEEELFVNPAGEDARGGAADTRKTLAGGQKEG
eukprot:6545432-Pyramimonas_sp.AAC.1